MAKLVPVLDSLDGVDAALRDFYIAGSGPMDGKYLLQVKPTAGWELDNVLAIKKLTD